MILKTKLLNYLLLKGNKNTSELVLLKAFKIAQKQTLKQSKKLLKLMFVFCTPLFKLYRIINKQTKNNNINEIPRVLLTKKSRIYASLNFVLVTLKNKNSTFFYKKFSQLILSLNTKTITDFYIELRNSSQKKALIKKHLLNYYRW